ncbi:non-reducing end beta-L-arabinofuranosidase [Striga asiatica]|uniref:Non-reducing end beta-L-arabinofuranosidase n=1 Tax=Striga asiatica TaxID=4170 RepID=A0A5A7Q0D0_STRAF|nr:non-reducing end beta-L-arabinofuranosidase [Striga asiatica]
MPKHNFHVVIQMLRLIVVCALFSGFVLGNKVCTNSGLQSHTSRYQLFSSSKNESWEGHNPNDLGLIPGHDHTWSESIPRKMLREEDEISWNILYKKTKGSDGVGGFGVGFLKEVLLHDVRLDPSSIHGVAQQTNLEYLLMLDVDRLVWSFRKTAGLETRGEPYGGWEAPSIELRGHFVGHYLSASAQMWASTHNASLEEKMMLLISALSDCQTKIGTGYLSAFPSELFDRFEALKEVWAPYYTIHKILAGLLDQYTLAGNSGALRMATWMVDYFYKRVQNVISKYTIERHWLSLNEETGGMNDVLYRLYIITGDQKHLLLAHLFDKPCFLGLLALKADDISGFHANTHIPIVIGAQLRYEITGELLYKEIGTFFMDIVNSSHSYATGGTSVSEFWSDPKRLASTLQTENQESCTTYNMLKVARYLFRWTKEMAYADYYERAVTNGVLGIQRGKEPGVMIYMLPFRAGGSKARGYHGWGNKFDSFWCCYGTGIESFSKLGDSIYFEEGKDLLLYIIQYIPSTLNWTSGQILLTQKVEPVASWDQRLRVTITISSNGQSERLSSTLNLRIPMWTQSNGSKASLNGQHVSLPAPGNFLSINKLWSPGDEITLDLPVLLRSEHIQDDRTEFASIQAFLYGPYLLAALSSGDWDLKIKLNTSLSDCFTPIPANYNSQLISLAQELKNSTFVLTNSNQIMKMEKLPEPGTDATLKSTFRLLYHSKTEKLVKLELFDFPDTFLSVDKCSSIFRLANGLDGKTGTVSLESESKKGCFIYSGLLSGLGPGVTLNCSSGPFDAGFRSATSFMLRHGISKYNPISFVAKGVKRNFVLVPLLSLRDESYTVYFNTSV